MSTFSALVLCSLESMDHGPSKSSVPKLFSAGPFTARPSILCAPFHWWFFLPLTVRKWISSLPFLAPSPLLLYPTTLKQHCQTLPFDNPAILQTSAIFQAPKWFTTGRAVCYVWWPHQSLKTSLTLCCSCPTPSSHAELCNRCQRRPVF